MRIALVHYHLHPGGVSRVIRRAAEGLAASGVAGVVLSGEPVADAASWPWPVRQVEGWGYAPESGLPQPEELVQRLRGVAKDALGGSPDVWHIHNHALGKNPAVTAAVALMAARGDVLLLQAHDFAEDGRPLQFAALRRYFAPDSIEELGPCLYPQGASVHYAVLNRRDRDFLCAAGWPDDRLHVVPNPIDVKPSCPPSQERLFLYPVRGIRRKNLGEFLLWSMLDRDRGRYAVTLAPRNPVEKPGYEAWKRLAHELRLPVEFEVGERPGATLEDWMRDAMAVITTSVTEGFGLAFMEPTAGGKPVVGRDLPEITKDFRQAGLEWTYLYERLDVPASWLDATDLSAGMEAGLKALYGAYGLPVSGALMERTREAFIKDGKVDFGQLDEERQRVVLRRLRLRPSDGAELKPSQLMTTAPDPAVLERNRMILERDFHVGLYAERLLGVYRSALHDTTTDAPTVSERQLLELFLAPERAQVLRAV